MAYIPVLGGGGGGFKVQRGVASAAGTIVISKVNMERAFVISVSKSSGGYVAATGSISASAISSGAISGSITGSLDGTARFTNGAAQSGYSPQATFLGGPTSYNSAVSVSGTRTLSGSLSGTVGAASISGGSTSLTARAFSAQLISPTELSVDGPCEWQVIESK